MTPADPAQAQAITRSLLLALANRREMTRQIDGHYAAIARLQAEHADTAEQIDTLLDHANALRG